MTKASKLRTQFSKLIFAPITKEILRAKKGRNAKKTPIYYYYLKFFFFFFGPYLNK
jgi:hypothetical protein